MGLAVGDVVAVTFEGRVQAQRTLTTFMIRRASPVDNNTTVIQDLDEITFHTQPDGGGADWLETAFLAACSIDFVLDNIVAQQITPTRSVKRVRVSGGPGTNAGGCEVTNICGVLTKRTNFGGRKQVGSVHMPGMPTLGATNGVLTAGQKLLYDNFATALKQAWIVPVSGTSYNNILYHRGLVPNYDIVTDVFTQDTVRTMRRRTVGVGI
jgi:hypothetical protein